MSRKALAVERGGIPSTQVQAILLPRDRFPNFSDAKSWAVDHGYATDRAELTPNHVHFRQRDPADFVEGLFRTKRMKGGILVRVGYPLKGKPAFRRDSAPASSAEDQWKKQAIERDIQAMDRVFNSKKLTSIADEWLPEERSDESIAAALTADQVLTGIKNVFILRGKPTTISTVRKLRLLRPDLKPAIDHAVAVLKLTRAEEKRELWEIDMTWKKVIAPRLDKNSIGEMLRAASERGLLHMVARRIGQCRPDLIGEVDRAIQRLKQG